MEPDREIIFGSETPSKTADEPFTIVQRHRWMMTDRDFGSWPTLQEAIAHIGGAANNHPVVITDGEGVIVSRH